MISVESQPARTKYIEDSAANFRQTVKGNADIKAEWGGMIVGKLLWANKHLFEPILTPRGGIRIPPEYAHRGVPIIALADSEYVERDETFATFTSAQFAVASREHRPLMKIAARQVAEDTSNRTAQNVNEHATMLHLMHQEPDPSDSSRAIYFNFRPLVVVRHNPESKASHVSAPVLGGVLMHCAQIIANPVVEATDVEFDKLNDDWQTKGNDLETLLCDLLLRQ